MAGNSGEPGRTVTSKLAAILTAFTSGRNHTLSELAMQTNLATSTVHRLLNDLVRASLLERLDGTTYHPGPTICELPHEAEQPTLQARAPFVVADLASSLHLTARLGVVDGLEVAYVEKKAGTEPGTLFPNPARLPLHATAMGKALLAFGPRSLAQLVSSGELTRHTARTLTTPAGLDCALRRTRARGFAVTDREHSPAAGAVGMAVFDGCGRAMAAIEVEVPGRSTDAVGLTVPALLTAARCLRRELAPREQAHRPSGPPPGLPDPARLHA